MSEHQISLFRPVGDGFPEAFPYECRPGVEIHRKDAITCEQCSRPVKHPLSHLVYIGDKYQHSITTKHETRNQNRLVTLCGEQCAMRYAWKGYCLRRLRGKMKGSL